MSTVHHQPANAALSWNLHAWESAWDGSSIWDVDGTASGATFDFQLPDIPDLRIIQLKYNSVDPQTNATVWEPDSFIRRFILPAPAEAWTFENSARIIYQNPLPAGVTFNAGDVLTVNVITQSQFRGGKIYVWDGYNPGNAPIYFPQTARDDVNFISTFQVTLAAWMTTGFHLKLMSPGTGMGGSDVWEPDASNRVWRPCDGNTLWLKKRRRVRRARQRAAGPDGVSGGGSLSGVATQSSGIGRDGRGGAGESPADRKRNGALLGQPAF